MFWSSVDLTGNQTPHAARRAHPPFWSSVDLTGNQTKRRARRCALRFGAVSI